MQVSDQTVLAIKGLLQTKGYVDIPSHGVSMFPLIRTGNICRFKPFCEKELKTGDILLYFSDSGLLVGHRYLRQRSDGMQILFICKGDSQAKDDPPLRREQLIGTLVSIRKLRMVLRADSALLSGWSKVITRLPFVSVGIHWYLRLNRKLWGMKVLT